MVAALLKARSNGIDDLIAMLHSPSHHLVDQLLGALSIGMGRFK